MNPFNFSNNFFILSLTQSSNKKLIEVTNYLKQTPQFVNQLTEELEKAIEIFNQKEFSPKNIYINALYLEKIINKLPKSSDIKISNTLQKNLINELENFEFINTMKPMKQLTSALLVATYRTYLLNNQPQLRQKNAQIASTIEEMLAYMAINNNDTLLFQATKHWIKDYKVEGFSKDLAKAIKKL